MSNKTLAVCAVILLAFVLILPGCKKEEPIEEPVDSTAVVDSLEMLAKLEMVQGMCICKDCPSWVECGEKGGYCHEMIGKSECITEKKGCVCPDCPVTKEMGLKYGYYCIDGSHKEIDAKMIEEAATEDEPEESS